MRNPHIVAETSALLPGGRLQYKSCLSKLSKETQAETQLRTCVQIKLFFIVPTVAVTAAERFKKTRDSSFLKSEDSGCLVSRWI